MIQTRFLQRSSHRLKGSHRDFTVPLKLSRNFSSILNRPATDSKLPSHSSSRPHIISSHHQLKVPPLAGRLALRYASNEAASTPVAEFVPDYASPTSFGEDFSGASLDKVLDQLPAAVHQYPGWLKDIGLDYGWGSTAMLERLLEYVHMYAGTPWWGSTVIVIVIIRTLLLKLYFDSADTNARYKLIKNIEAPLQERYKQAMRTQDAAETRKVWSEMNALRKSAGMKMWKQFVPLVQIPISFSLFRLQRGMSTLPAPGYETGGFLWVKDLTVPDPYFIMPIVQTVALYGTIALGGETGSNPEINTTFQKFIKYFLPGISGVIVLFWPAGMQLSFCITAIFSITQSTLLRSNDFRRLIGIQQLGQQPYVSNLSTYTGTITRYQPPGASGTANPQKGPSGVISEIKSGASALWKQAHKRVEDRRKPTGRRTPAELKHAKAYDERRKREIALEKEAEAAEKAEREEWEKENRRRRRR